MGSSAKIWRSHDMILFKNRLASLETWPVDFIDKREIARSGFYFTADPKPDSVQCFACDGVIQDWEINDDPHDVHRLLKPDCDFYKRLERPFTYLPRHPQFSSMHQRFLTFREWPSTLSQTPSSLLNAGFYYKNYGDRVACYYCDVVLNQWSENDDPWMEHAYFSPECTYVQVKKGVDYIQNIRNTHKPVTRSVTISKPAMVEDDNAEPANRGDVCTICMDANKNVIYIPCGHLAACPTCSMATPNCPICRQTYTDAVRMYE